MKVPTNTFIRHLAKQIQLLTDVLPHESEINKIRIQREIFTLEARIFQLKKHHKQNLKISIETYESSINKPFK